MELPFEARVFMSSVELMESLSLAVKNTVMALTRQ